MARYTSILSLFAVNSFWIVAHPTPIEEIALPRIIPEIGTEEVGLSGDSKRWDEGELTVLVGFIEWCLGHCVFTAYYCDWDGSA
jgi:hypothetical protein